MFLMETPTGKKMTSAYLSTVAVDEILHVNANSTGALIQDGKLGLMVEEPSHLCKKTITL